MTSQQHAWIQHWLIPDSRLPGHTIEHFLRTLNGPARLEIPGRDSSRCRVLVTLLHGNETSGIKALHALLGQTLVPAVTIYVYIIAIDAALLPPLFAHRQVPGKHDYNRCFRPPFDDDFQSRVCQALLEDICQLQPEAVVDMHNTSGDGPAFSITVRHSAHHEALVSLFTERLVITDLQLGSLMETDTDEIPVVTVECGGAAEESADRFARESLLRYFSKDVLFEAPATDLPLDIYHKPVRIELPRTGRVAYADTIHPEADLILKSDIEHHNFNTVAPDTFLGWIGGNSVWRPHAWQDGMNRFDALYRIDKGKLYPRVAQKLFMITNNPVIAVSDCLWYAVTIDE